MSKDEDVIFTYLHERSVIDCLRETKVDLSWAYICYYAMLDDIIIFLSGLVVRLRPNCYYS